MVRALTTLCGLDFMYPANCSSAGGACRGPVDHKLNPPRSTFLLSPVTRNAQRSFFFAFFPQLLIVRGRLLAAEAFGVQWPFHGAMVALSVRGGRVDTACSMQLGYFSVPECEGYVVP